jgi:hypothetical protein
MINSWPASARVASRARLPLGILSLSSVLFGLSGCDRGPRATTVAMHAHVRSVLDSRVLEVRADLSTPRAGVLFKWFAVHGECNPQESSVPMTLFRFAEGVRTDHVVVEVWDHGIRVARNRLDVAEGPPTAAQPARDVRIEITQIPVAAPGGPDTRAEISGKVSGAVSPDYRVVIYARDNGVWWIQPTVFEKHEIRADHTWATWTHTGQAYAALVVQSDFDPIRTLDTLPRIDGNVLARMAVEGRRQ